MTAPRIESCYFARPQAGAAWTRMARVLEDTARQHCQGWSVHVLALPPAPMPTHVVSWSFAANTHKLDHWRAVVEAAANGDRILLLDADTAIVRPLDDIWDRPFDLAMTTKRDRFPFNAGVVFLRVSPPIRAFMRAWVSTNREFLLNGDLHKPWRSKHGGLNQSALGCLLATGALADLDVLELPCAEWNCEDSAWATFDADRTRILHIKSALRVAVIERQPCDARMKPAADYWRARERDLLRRTA
jgi:hypothetical protein